MTWVTALVVILLSLTLTPEVLCAPSRSAVPSVLVPALPPAVTHIPPQDGDQTVATS